MSPLRLVPFLRIVCTAAAVSLPGPRPAAAAPHPATGPDEARRALEQGRFLHASLLLRDHFATVRDTAPDEILLAARAEGGWGNWERVVQLLSGRAWLDSLDQASGWEVLGYAHGGLERWTDSRDAFTRFLALAPSAESRRRGRAEIARAIAHTHNGETADALAAFAAARTLLPNIADWIALEATAAAAAAGDTGIVRTLLAGIDAELARENGWRHRIEALSKAGDPAGALAAAEAAANEPGSASRRGAAWVEAGRLRLTAGDAAGARSAFRNAIATAPGTSSGVDGARMLSELSGLTPDDHLRMGRIWLRHGNLTRAISGLQTYINSGGGSASEREQLRWELGQAQFRAARYDDAERTLLGIASRNAGSTPALAADALFYAGRSQYRDGRVTLARRTFVDVARQFPGQAGAAKALYMAGDLDQDDGEIDRAAERFRQAIATGADVDEVGLAHMRLANIAYQRRDYEGARAAFDAYRSRYPNGRRYVQAAYWAGLSAARSGDTATARTRFEEVRRMDPFSYYGGRAADLLGVGFADLPLAPSPESSAADHEAVARVMADVDLLRDVGWDGAAAWVVDRARQRLGGSTGTAYAFAEALNERGLAMTGIALGWDLFRKGGGWNARLLRVIYPLPFRDIIIEEARERAVDPFLAAGLIRQESMFDPGAVSTAGAIGLMQVVPATGRALAGRLGVRRFDDDMLKHAEFNAHLGMAYLNDQLAAFEGRLPVVLAAYNAGPHRITRWRDFPEFADDETFSERIPFAETRDYVKIVQNNARIYAGLYGSVVEHSTR